MNRGGCVIDLCTFFFTDLDILVKLLENKKICKFYHFQLLDKISELIVKKIFYFSRQFSCLYPLLVKIHDCNRCKQKNFINKTKKTNVSVSVGTYIYNSQFYKLDEIDIFRKWSIMVKIVQFFNILDWLGLLKKYSKNVVILKVWWIF